MSDRLAVMREGEIEQVGAPRDVYDSPSSVYVADFLGLANLLPARVVGDGRISVAGVELAAETSGVDGACTVFARPERLRIVPPTGGALTAAVRDVVFVGSTTHVRAGAGDLEVQVVVPNDGSVWVPAPGTDVAIEVPPEALRVLTR